jgi:hypothetical protein
MVVTSARLVAANRIFPIGAISSVRIEERRYRQTRLDSFMIWVGMAPPNPPEFAVIITTYDRQTCTARSTDRLFAEALLRSLNDAITFAH